MCLSELFCLGKRIYFYRITNDIPNNIILPAYHHFIAHENEKVSSHKVSNLFFTYFYTRIECYALSRTYRNTKEALCLSCKLKT